MSKMHAQLQRKVFWLFWIRCSFCHLWWDVYDFFTKIWFLISQSKDMLFNFQVLARSFNSLTKNNVLKEVFITFYNRVWEKCDFNDMTWHGLTTWQTQYLPWSSLNISLDGISQANFEEARINFLISTAMLYHQFFFGTVCWNKKCPLDQIWNWLAHLIWINLHFMWLHSSQTNTQSF